MANIIDDELSGFLGINNSLEGTVDYLKQIIQKTGTLGTELRKTLHYFNQVSAATTEINDIETKINSGFHMGNKALKNRFAEMRALNTLAEQRLNMMHDEQSAHQAAMSAIIPFKDQIRDAEAEIHRLNQLLSSNTGNRQNIINQIAHENIKARKAELEIEKKLSDKKVAAYEMALKTAEESRKSVDYINQYGQSLIETNMRNFEFTKAASNKFAEKLLNALGLNKIKDFYKNVQDFGMKGAVGIGLAGGAATVLVALAKEFVKLSFRANQEFTDLRRNFNVSAEYAKEFRQYLYEASNISDGIASSYKEIADAANTLREQSGLVVLYKQEEYKFASNLLHQMKLSAEEMGSMQLLANASGKDFDKIAKTILVSSKMIQANNKVYLDDRKILGEVLKISGGIRLNFSGNVQEMAKAVAQTKILGTSLSKIDAMANSLMDFQSSIESELEAELITNKALNFERARAAALTNDQVQMLMEMNSQIGTFDEYAGMNRIAQERLAKAFGMSRDEMSDMLFEQKAITTLKQRGLFDERMSMQKNIDMLNQSGKLTDELVDTIGQAYINNMIAQSSGERFEKVMVKIQDILAKIFTDGALVEKLVVNLISVIETIADKGLLGIFSGSAIAEREKKYTDMIRSGDPDSRTTKINLSPDWNAIMRASNNNMTATPVVVQSNLYLDNKIVARGVEKVAINTQTKGS